MIHAADPKRDRVLLEVLYAGGGRGWVSSAAWSPGLMMTRVIAGCAVRSRNRLRADPGDVEGAIAALVDHYEQFGDLSSTFRPIARRSAS